MRKKAEFSPTSLQYCSTTSHHSFTTFHPCTPPSKCAWLPTSIAWFFSLLATFVSKNEHWHSSLVGSITEWCTFIWHYFAIFVCLWRFYACLIYLLLSFHYWHHRYLPLHLISKHVQVREMCSDGGTELDWFGWLSHWSKLRREFWRKATLFSTVVCWM